MLMTNEYRSAYKRVHNAEEVESLRASGWTVVEEQPTPDVQTETPQAEEPMKAPPRIVKGGKNQLMYRDKYLSQWVRIATKKELRDIFDHYGIPYAYNSSKNDMVIRLRQYIRETKEEQRREAE